MRAWKTLTDYWWYATVYAELAANRIAALGDRYTIPPDTRPRYASLARCTGCGLTQEIGGIVGAGLTTSRPCAGCGLTVHMNRDHFVDEERING